MDLDPLAIPYSYFQWAAQQALINNGLNHGLGDLYSCRYVQRFAGNSRKLLRGSLDQSSQTTGGGIALDCFRTQAKCAAQGGYPG